MDFIFFQKSQQCSAIDCVSVTTEKPKSLKSSEFWYQVFYVVLHKELREQNLLTKGRNLQLILLSVQMF